MTKKSPPRRWAAIAVIATLLALQVGLAIGYYVGDDRFDERFAWRMFSTIRLTKCNTLAAERLEGDTNERPIVLTQKLAAAWISNIRRNRDQVIRKFVESRCEMPDVDHVRVQNICRVPGEPRERHQWTIDCEVGEVVREVSEL